MKNLRRFGDILALDASVYEQYDVYVHRAIQERFLRRSARMEEIITLLVSQKRDEEPRTYTRVGISFQNVVQRRVSGGIEEGG